jgi:hypothetical protein
MIAMGLNKDRMPNCSRLRSGEAMYPEDVNPESGCRLPPPRREQLDDAGCRTYDWLADPKGGTIRGLRGPGGILLRSPELSRHARPLNRYLRSDAMPVRLCLALEPHSLGSSRSIARFWRIPSLSGLNSQPASS